MPLTPFQQRLLADLTHDRSADSHLAVGALCWAAVGKDPEIGCLYWSAAQTGFVMPAADFD